jgi:hypothetical protein
LPQTDGDYDWEADAKGCWALAIKAIADRVAAGEPIPDFFLSERKP